MLAPESFPLTTRQFRHTTIAGAREKPTGHWRQREPDLGSVPAIYWMYILGSGGHTTEMLQAIRGHAKLNENAHRRYLFTSGDQNSLYHIQALERHFAWDHRLLSDGVGTSDICQIQRARSVHQSYLSSIFTSIRTVGDVIVALTKAPTKRPTSTYGDVFRYPKVIVTNGPGTGFIVCLVAHLLKMFYVIPESCCKVIYIETWAHVTSLSLTGKLFHWFDLADLYIVQHKPLAYKYGKYFLVVVDTPETRKARFQYPPSREDLVAMEQKSGAPDVAAKHRGQQL